MNNNSLFEQSLIENMPSIRRVVGRVCKRSDYVDDISQEVCARIIEKEKLWNKEPSQLRAWMNAIARNFTINYLAKKREKNLEEIKKEMKTCMKKVQ